MTSLGAIVEPDVERLNLAARLGRELAELVDEWSVTPSGFKSQQIASEMIHKSRELLRASAPLARVAKTA